MRRSLFVGVSVALAGTIFYLAILYTGSLPDHPMIRGYNDLVMHFLAFAVLAVPCLLLLPIVAAMLTVATFAGAIEIVHLTLPSRTASIVDLLAGWLGIAISAAFFVGIKHHFGGR